MICSTLPVLSVMCAMILPEETNCKRKKPTNMQYKGCQLSTEGRIPEERRS